MFFVEIQFSYVYLFRTVTVNASSQLQYIYIYKRTLTWLWDELYVVAMAKIQLDETLIVLKTQINCQQLVSFKLTFFSKMHIAKRMPPHVYVATFLKMLKRFIYVQQLLVNFQETSEAERVLYSIQKHFQEGFPNSRQRATFLQYL